MAMLNPSALSGQAGKHNADLTSQIFLDSPSFDEVIQSIADAIARESPSGFRLLFRWAADDVENFHSQLSQLPQRDAISRFEYDYRSGILSLTMGESKGHALWALYLCLVILQKIRTIALTTSDEAVREAANKIITIGTAAIKVKGKLWNQPDVSFASLGDTTEATVVFEVAWSQSQQDVEDKAENYINGSNGKIQAVVILDALYPDLEEAVVSLLVAAHDDGFRWEQRRQVIHSDHLEQPDGVVGLYLSDFCGPSGLPAAYCRPPAGVSRFVFHSSFYLFLPAILTRSISTGIPSWPSLTEYWGRFSVRPGMPSILRNIS